MVPQYINDFFGQWAITREIEDRRAGQLSHAEGSVVISETAEGARFQERLTLYLPGQPAMKAERRYLWQVSGTAVSVCFEDGRDFHQIQLGQAQSADHHDCAPDTYDVVYDFSQWPIWCSEWTVRGARKDYVMRSKMTAA